MATTQSSHAVDNCHQCNSYKAATFTLVAIIVLLLTHKILTVARAASKRKQRHHAGEQEGGVVTIGRTQRNKAFNSKTISSRSENETNLRTLRDFSSCPVFVPSIQITHDDANDVPVTSHDVTYSQVGRPESEEQRFNQKTKAASPKPSGEYADLLTESGRSQQQNFPAIKKLLPNASGSLLQRDDSLYIAPASHHLRNDDMDTTTLSMESIEETDVFPPAMNASRKYPLTSALKRIPRRVSSTFSSTGANPPSSSRSSIGSSACIPIYLSFREDSGKTPKT